MEYKLNEQKEVITVDPNSIEVIKRNLMHLLVLREEEMEVISNIKSAKELSEFLNKPEQYLAGGSVNALKELLELIDLLGGMYFA